MDYMYLNSKSVLKHFGRQSVGSIREKRFVLAMFGWEDHELKVNRTLHDLKAYYSIIDIVNDHSQFSGDPPPPPPKSQLYPTIWECTALQYMGLSF